MHHISDDGSSSSSSNSSTTLVQHSGPILDFDIPVLVWQYLEPRANKQKTFDLPQQQKGNQTAKKF